MSKPLRPKNAYLQIRGTYTGKIIEVGYLGLVSGIAVIPSRNVKNRKHQKNQKQFSYLIQNKAAAKEDNLRPYLKTIKTTLFCIL